MKTIFTNKYLLLSARLLLAFIFIYAAVLKISDPEPFAQSIANYKLTPLFLTNILAIVFPWIELTASILLLFGIAVRENSLILSSLLLIFTVAIIIGLLRGLNIECGCFGTASGSKIGVQKIFENAGLLILGIWIFMKDSNQISLTTQLN